MGEWIYRKIDQHVCNKPQVTQYSGVHENDQWRCDCGQVWRIRKVVSGSDPRPGEGDYFWVEWEAVANPRNPDPREFSPR